MRKATPQETSRLIAVSQPDSGMPSVTIVSQVKSPEAGMLIDYRVFISGERGRISRFVYREIVSGTEKEGKLTDDGTLKLPIS